MKEPLQLILPMGGAGTRFFNNGFDCPKPMIQLHGKPFFYWATQSIYDRVPVGGLTFVIQQEHQCRFGLGDAIRSYYPHARIVELPQVLPGAVLTCLKGVEGLPDNAPVLFNDCDHYFRSQALKEFLESGAEADGALLTFTAHEPQFSYVELDDRDNVVRTVEKQVISDKAICGAYYFGSKSLFCRYAEQYLQECTYKEFFLSGVYNPMARDHLQIKALPVDLHIPFGTPAEYQAAGLMGEEFTL